MKKKSIFINLFLFVLLLFLTFFFVFRKISLHDFFLCFAQVNPFFIFLGILFMCSYILCEAINMHFMFTHLKENVTFLQTVKYAVLGFFFSSVTPSSSGGQPMQLYAMSQDKILVSHATIVLLIQITCYQIVACLLGFIGYLFHYKIILSLVGPMKYIFFLGIFINVMIVFFLLASLFSEKIVDGFCKLIKKILLFFKYKRIDSFMENVSRQVIEYQTCAKYLKSHPFILFRVFLVTFLQLCFYHTIPYLVYLSFGLQGHSYFSFLFMESMLFISISSLPFPGSMGIGEGGFMFFFQFFFPVTVLGSAMLLSRFVSFYFFVFVTGSCVLFLFIRRMIVKNKILR